MTQLFYAADKSSGERRMQTVAQCCALVRKVSGFMPFVDLDDVPIGSKKSELEAICAPFVLREIIGTDPEWESAFKRRRQKINAHYWRQRLMGWLPQRQRTETNWGEFDYASYDQELKAAPINLWVWGDRRMFAPVRLGARLRQYLLVKVIEAVKPRRVLEVGSGNGINLLLLAGRFPDVEFHGVDLSDHGIASAKGLQSLETFPENLIRFAPFPLRDHTAFKRVNFQQGSAAALPFENNRFDLVYTCVAVEQMERIRAQALSEIARVSDDNVLFYEPFRDVNRQKLAHRYMVARDYFRGSIDDLLSHGLRPQWATNDLPQKINNNNCMVFCRKA
jgi:ubiquinone/menaquinone biosynthesis C-methylase UbiE